MMPKHLNGMTELLVAHLAVITGTAGNVVMQTHAISSSDICYLRTDLFHRPGHFMSQGNWHLPHARAPGAVVRVRVTNACGSYAHKNVILTYIWNGYFLPLQRLASLHHADGFHVFSKSKGDTPSA